MSDIKISALSNKTPPENADLIPIGDLIALSKGVVNVDDVQANSSITPATDGTYPVYNARRSSCYISMRHFQRQFNYNM